MHESPEDIARIQDLLDRSYRSAGPHLRSIHTAERRITAEDLVRRLQGMRLLVLATVSSAVWGAVGTFLDGGPVYGRIDADRLFAIDVTAGTSRYSVEGHSPAHSAGDDDLSAGD